MALVVWGHRGCRGTGNPPENSLAAFQTAIDQGAAGIELDLFLTKDHHLVVFHDDTLERMTAGKGDVTSYTLAELKLLPLKNSSGQMSKERIPTYEEVLDLVERHRNRAKDFVVNTEIKGQGIAAEVAEAVRRRLAKDWRAENFLISSFDMASLREIREAIPAVPVGALFDGTLDETELARHLAEVADIHPNTVNVTLSSLTPRAVTLIRGAGAAPVAWISGETNPDALPYTARLAMAKQIKDHLIILITDYPKEMLQLLKPNMIRAAATGMLAAYLCYGETARVFNPAEAGLEGVRPPAEYAELKGLGFTERELVAEDGISFTIWEKKGDLDKPHYLLFHGNRAHWGDTGPGEPVRDRRARLKCLQVIAASGAGLTAVSLRGFGKSHGTPSETGFSKDIETVIAHLFARGIHHRKLVIVGESLGTWAGAQTAVRTTQLNRPPALLTLQNPFTSLAELGEQVIGAFPMVRSLNINLPAATLDRHILKNHFYTANLIRELSPATAVHIATSGKDDLIPPSHSDRLAAIAREHGLTVYRDYFPESLHHDVPPAEFAKRVLYYGNLSCQQRIDQDSVWFGCSRANAVDYLIPSL